LLDILFNSGVGSGAFLVITVSIVAVDLSKTLVIDCVMCASLLEL
jgi:hypothetical protein